MFCLIAIPIISLHFKTFTIDKFKNQGNVPKTVIKYVVNYHEITWPTFQNISKHWSVYIHLVNFNIYLEGHLSFTLRIRSIKKNEKKTLRGYDLHTVIPFFLHSLQRKHYNFNQW